MNRYLHLGDLLAFREYSSERLGGWLKAVDSVWAAHIEAAAWRRNETLSQFVRIAVSDFVAEAGEEDWASLISAARDSNDPAARCLRAIIAFRVELEREA